MSGKDRRTGRSAWKSRPLLGQRPGGAPVAGKPAPVYGPLPGPWPLHVLILIGLVGATLLLYASTIELGFFHLDDPTYVQTNPYLKAVSWTNFQAILTQPYFANYSPMHILSYLVDYQLGGESARTFHLSSILWGGCVAGGVYLLGLIVLGGAMPAQARGTARLPFLERWRTVLLAGSAALLFVVHPVHVEVIAWISSRKDLVAAAFALPCVLCYLLYRRGAHGPLFYAVSLVLFLLAVAGKLSVVVLPGILWLFDLLVERRRGWSMVWDKIPYAVLGLMFTWPTMGAQPSTRQGHNLFILTHSMVKSAWLLTGLGDYVLVYERFVPGTDALVEMVSLVLVAALLLGPVVFRRHIPGPALVLYYWVFLALVPSQVLSFIHPVTDRYLFFPSAAAVLLVAWMAGRVRVRPRHRAVPWVALLLLAGVWTWQTAAYLAEWNDPRSVWHGASRKSRDYLVSQYLGTHYHDQADQLPNLLTNSPATRERVVALARLVWKEDPRLSALLAEWEGQVPSATSPIQQAYQNHLRQLAMERYEAAVRNRSTQLMANLYFRMGSIALTRREPALAREHFGRAIAEARQSGYQEQRDDVIIRAYHALGLVEWQMQNYSKALEWMRQAEQAQQLAGKIYVRELPQHRQQLEGLAREPKG